jgi:hypothetical protein
MYSLDQSNLIALSTLGCNRVLEMLYKNKLRTGPNMTISWYQLPSKQTTLLKLLEQALSHHIPSKFHHR